MPEIRTFQNYSGQVDPIMQTHKTFLGCVRQVTTMNPTSLQGRHRDPLSALGMGCRFDIAAVAGARGRLMRRHFLPPLLEQPLIRPER